MIQRRFVIAIAAIVACLLIAADAHARAGGGSSGGSRGTRTFSAPPATQTAPNAAAPMQRTVTQPGKSNTVGQATPRPGLFGGGLLGGLAAGFLGAGLFGLLFGHGLFGGMAGFASFIGLMFQIALVVIVARLLFVWWQRRNAPAPAYAAAHPATGHSFSGLGGMLGGNAPAAAALTIDKSDYDEFERLLGEIQTAYSDENLNALRAKVTPRCCPISPSSSPKMRAAALSTKSPTSGLSKAISRKRGTKAVSTMRRSPCASPLPTGWLIARASALSKAACQARPPNCGLSCARVAARSEERRV